jgi:3-dehydroquinate synthase
MSTTAETVLCVRAPGADYSIILGRGLLERLGALSTRAGLGRRVVVATDENVAALYGERVLAALGGAGFEPAVAVMPAGEPAKHWGSVSLFVDAFVRAALGRDGWVAALGGGVVGDTAGFAASIYMRGVPCVQVPTTLLAMADSSVGGKVGVDHPSGKNLLGAFKQPHMVVADLDTLDTLPPVQVGCGMAEVIKAGIIGDPDLFDLVERATPQDFDFEAALPRAITVKRDIVEADPYEAGSRMLLNMGHTFGHALETCTGYARLHGIAVGQGLVLASRLARRLSMCDSGVEERTRAVLDRWQLPGRWGAPDLTGDDDAHRVYAAMLGDKKRRDGHLRLVLPEAVGSVRVVEDVAREDILAVLRELQ